MNSVLNPVEQAAYALRELYRTFGYEQYKVSKFEEYDLYARNKSFLSSKEILTFTDTNGHLMALKPDITLSIVKNTPSDNRIQKLWYTENVYRVPRNAYGFQEITQTGLEFIGPVDLYAMSEVLMLAARSLELISPRYVLELSHIGILSGILSAADISGNAAHSILSAIGEKNTHELCRACADAHIPTGTAELLQTLCLLSGPARNTLDALMALPLPEESLAAAGELSAVCRLLEGFGDYHVQLDLSVLNDMSYYTGIIFRGYVDGIAAGVLSGGRYDRLLKKMGKESGAIGFAVYLDELNRFLARTPEYDVDTLLVYGPETDPARLVALARTLTEEGQRVRIQPEGPASVTCRRKIGPAGKEFGP